MTDLGLSIALSVLGKLIDFGLQTHTDWRPNSMTLMPKLYDFENAVNLSYKTRSMIGL